MDSGVMATAGAEIYWQAHGQGPAVVLAHGIGGNHAIWYAQIDALARSGLVATERGTVLIRDRTGLARLAAVQD